MTLPQFYISLYIDIEYGVGQATHPYVAASNRIRGLKLPYGEYSELRDFIRNLFSDNVKFRTLGFKPSNNAIEDKNRLSLILPLRKTDPSEYERQIASYLETEPQSKSFYIVADALNSDNVSISRWILDVRISDHNLPASTLGIDNQEFLDSQYAEEHADSTWLPVRFKITYNIKHIQDTVYNEYQVDIADRFNKYPPITSASIDEIKQGLVRYVSDLWAACNELIPGDSEHTVESSNYIRCSTMYDAQDIENIEADIEYYISAYRDRLCEQGDYQFAGYQWTCIYAKDDADGYITQLIISDNFGETFSLDCDIYIADYLEDESYRAETLLDICIALLEGYGPNW